MAVFERVTRGGHRGPSTSPGRCDESQWWQCQCADVGSGRGRCWEFSGFWCGPLAYLQIIPLSEILTYIALQPAKRLGVNDGAHMCKSIHQTIETHTLTQSIVVHGATQLSVIPTLVSTLVCQYTQPHSYSPSHTHTHCPREGPW